MSAGNGRPSSEGRALVVWDIDGTLVGHPRSGGMLFEDALGRVLGRDGLAPPAPTHGKTDHGVILDLLLREGLDEPGAALLVPVVMRELEAITVDPAMVEREYAPLRGAQAAIDAVAATGAVQTYVTGNSPARAVAKLAPFGLDRRLDVRCGGFGDRTKERWRLVDEARRRAGLVHAGAQDAIDGRRTVVVGDTIHDVAAALQAGGRPVAVATGSFSADDLHGAGAELVLSDLESGLDELLAFVRAVAAG